MRRKIFFGRNSAGQRQRGAAAVEFGIIAMLFFLLFLGIVEMGRFFYLFNTVQEVTRCAAREAVVNGNCWDNIARRCLFRGETTTGKAELVAGWEISHTGAAQTNTNVQITYLNRYGAATTAQPPDSDTYISTCQTCQACLDNPSAGDCSSKCQQCVRYVEASVQQCTTTNKTTTCSPVTYQPAFGLFSFSLGIPGSTVRMPAESLGYRKTDCN